MRALVIGACLVGFWAVPAAGQSVFLGTLPPNCTNGQLAVSDGNNTWTCSSTPALGAVTATTVDTGQGANELYDMDQNVLTTSNPVFAGVDFGAAGVRFTGAAGVLTMCGIGPGADECLLYNFDATSNRVGISSSSGATRLSHTGLIPAFLLGITGTGLLDTWAGGDFTTGIFQIDANVYSGVAFVGAGNNVFSVHQEFFKTRSTDGTTAAIVQNNDELGVLNFWGDDGVDYNNWAASIRAEVDGTPGSNDMPGRLEFHTTPDGSNTTVERLRINNAGLITTLGTAPAVADVGAASCGTTAAAMSATATNHGGKVTVGATSGTECRITFTTTWPAAPACFVNNETTANLARAISTTTTVDLEGTFVGADVLAWICQGQQ